MSEAIALNNFIAMSNVKKAKALWQTPILVQFDFDQTETGVAHTPEGMFPSGLAS